jgi:hypothetical protein
MVTPQNMDLLSAAILYGAGIGTTIIVVSQIKSLRDTILYGSLKDVLTVSVSLGLGGAIGIYFCTRLLRF